MSWIERVFSCVRAPSGKLSLSCGWQAHTPEHTPKPKPHNTDKHARLNTSTAFTVNHMNHTFGSLSSTNAVKRTNTKRAPHSRDKLARTFCVQSNAHQCVCRTHIRPHNILFFILPSTWQMRWKSNVECLTTINRTLNTISVIFTQTSRSTRRGLFAGSLAHWDWRWMGYQRPNHWLTHSDSDSDLGGDDDALRWCCWWCYCWWSQSLVVGRRYGDAERRWCCRF